MKHLQLFSPRIQSGDNTINEYALWVLILYTIYEFDLGPLYRFT